MKLFILVILFIIPAPLAYACRCADLGQSSRFSEIDQVIKNGGFIGLVRASEIEKNGWPFDWAGTFEFILPYANIKPKAQKISIQTHEKNNCDVPAPKNGALLEVILKKQGDKYRFLPTCSGLTESEWQSLSQKYKLKECKNAEWSHAANFHGRILKCAE
ncbi:MAG: hypothetical protein DI586_03135 [Micavibrio aeruginosavorus]|uniref:Uncharacterized protein n=1 Tax=Micavibrio aeruginosavorus TaxID=349221 RepID=A0A2W5FS38_9BACT|nr:MAG: hypothetical protein DI586_03135 [Micavibrio aeruginosavorus]